MPNRLLNAAGQPITTDEMLALAADNPGACLVFRVSGDNVVVELAKTWPDDAMVVFDDAVIAGQTAGNPRDLIRSLTSTPKRSRKTWPEPRRGRGKKR